MPHYSAKDGGADEVESLRTRLLENRHILPSQREEKRKVPDSWVQQADFEREPGARQGTGKVYN